MRAGAESSRTTASVGSLDEQTLFAQRSPYGHPKSEISSQVCFGRGDLTLWIGGPSGEARPPRRTSNGPDGGGLGRPGLRRVRGGGALSSIPGPSAALVGVSERSRGLQVRDHRPCCCERSLTVPA